MEFQSLISNKIKSYVSDCTYMKTYDKFIHLVQNRHACMHEYWTAYGATSVDSAQATWKLSGKCVLSTMQRSGVLTFCVSVPGTQTLKPTLLHSTAYQACLALRAERLNFLSA